MSDDPRGEGPHEPSPATSSPGDPGIAIGDDAVSLTLYRRIDFPDLPPPPAPLPDGQAAPVAPSERLDALDLLRGIAVLGILLMNVVGFALPMGAYEVPAVAGGAEGLDLVTWWVSQVFVQQKFLNMFAMLFGAGVALMYDRAAARGTGFGGLHTRRMGILLLIGAAHGYLLWWGDVLWSYGFVGLFLFFFRRRSPRTLLTWAIVLVVAALGLQLAMGAFFHRAQAAHQEMLAAEASGEPLDDATRELARAFEEQSGMRDPGPAELERDLAIHRGSYAGIVAHRAPIVTGLQFFVTPVFLLPRILGIMLLGMFLYRNGMLAGGRSPGAYRRLAIVGYVTGLPLCVLSATARVAVDFDYVHKMTVDSPLLFSGSILVALGHVSVILLIRQAGWWTRLGDRLRAVGRMAFSNYLAQSVMGTTLFYGYGFGLYGHLSRFQLMGVVLAMWILQLLWSPWWLRRFRYGPAEWAWRSLTYGHRPPFRREAS